VATLKEWAAQFPDRKATHFVFPAERVGFSGASELAQVFDTNPAKAITSWKTAWISAKARARIECRFHDLRHTAVTRLLEAGQPFAVVADIMGWSAATTVRMAKRYATSETQRAATQWPHSTLLRARQPLTRPRCRCTRNRRQFSSTPPDRANHGAVTSDVEKQHPPRLSSSARHVGLAVALPRCYNRVLAECRLSCRRSRRVPEI
jgi:hypothetical protein